jgi:uncharacterized OsmC-like protein
LRQARTFSVKGTLATLKPCRAAWGGSDIHRCKETTMTSTAKAMQSSPTMNGLDLNALVATVDALKHNPGLAQFEFRATNQWVNGGENRPRIKEFYGAGQEDMSRRQAWEFVNGEPPVLLGANEGANPVEFLLHALACCVTTTTVLHAAARGIAIRKLSTELKGKINLQGLLDLDPAATVGYERIDIAMDIDADCSDEEMDALLAFAKAHSPVCNTVCRPVPVNIERVPH